MPDPNLSLNKDLVSFVCTLTRTPDTWREWKCIDISIEHVHNYNDNKVALLCAKSLAESYLVNHNIHCFLCPPHNLYILCKNIEQSKINSLESYITSMVTLENDQNLFFQVYAFDQELDSFLSKIQEQGDVGPLSIEPTISHLKSDLSPNKNIKVLLVEDDPVTRWIVRNAVKDECHLATATSASHACTLYPKFRPDIVFLDIGLPDKTGLDVLAWILKHDPGARVVMFSSQDSLDTITSTIESGAIGFVAKPFQRDELVNYIRHTKQNSISTRLYE